MIDQIKAEIERRIKQTELRRGEASADGARETLYWLKDFIESLEKKPKPNICPRCAYYQYDSCNYPGGGRNTLYNENGICECNMFESLEKEQLMICPRSKSKSFFDNPDMLKNALEKEQEPKGYDKAYLQEKIDLATKNGSWRESPEKEQDAAKYLQWAAMEYASKAALLSSSAAGWRTSDITDAYKAGYEYGCRHAAVLYDDMEKERQRRQEKEQEPKGLDDATKEYCDEHNDDCFDAVGDICPHLPFAFKAGAKWMAEQGETVEGEIVCAVAYPHENKVIARVYDDYKFGDKMIVQIRRKE